MKPMSSEGFGAQFFFTPGCFISVHFLKSFYINVSKKFERVSPRAIAPHQGRVLKCSALLCSVLQGYVLLCIALLCCAMYCRAVHCIAMHCCAIAGMCCAVLLHCRVVPCYALRQCRAVLLQCRAVLCSVVHYSVVQCCAVPGCAAPCLRILSQKPHGYLVIFPGCYFSLLGL